MQKLMNLDSNQNFNTVTIIGYGVVGRATHFIIDQSVNVYIHDPLQNYEIDMDFVASQSDIIFLCLPTPSDTDGSCDVSILSDYLEAISVRYRSNGPVVVVRSTCPPDFLEAWQDQLDLVFMPEFLTERDWRTDALNPRAVILGGERPCVQRVQDFLQLHSHYATVEITATDIKTASLVKYATNCFYATKVTYMNMLYDLCQRLDMEWPEFNRVLRQDHRMGPEHLDVPGPDGLRGFGGKCFPKDLRALINFAQDRAVESNLLSAVIKDNARYRK